jgi:hypothetical protein
MSDPIAGELKFKNSPNDWALRAVIFGVFLFFGSRKFTSDPNAPWVVLYDQIGFGQWFRYFTGAIEIAGAFLVLISQTVTAGMVMLGLVLTGAVLIDLLVLHQFVDAFLPFAILSAMGALWMHRRRV